MSERGLDAYGALGRDVGFGYLDQQLDAPRRHHPQLVLNDDRGTVLQAIRRELRTASAFTFSVAFVSASGIALLKQSFIDFAGVGEIITSDYLGFNSPAAFDELLALEEIGIRTRVHRSGAFHPKGYVFRREGHVTAMLGSSNLTSAALLKNHEWNLKVSAASDSDLAAQFINLVDAEQLDSDPLTAGWVQSYAAVWIQSQQRAPQSARPISPESTSVLPEVTDNDREVPFEAQATFDHGRPIADDGHTPSGDTHTLPTTRAVPRPLAPTIEPNTMQLAALESIQAMRESGERKALVISATGTGKTILAALDVRAARPQRMLFIAHREQILDRAIDEFSRVLDAPRSAFGKLTGGTKHADRRFVFSTVQTLSRPDTLASFDAHEFDYILVDEVHRAAAGTYQRVLEHFRPAFLLGLTATPERSDGQSIFELFDFNVPYEIRLGEALREGMLAPFHYYGVADFVWNDGTTTTDVTPLYRLVSEERIRHLLDTIHRYGQAGVEPRGLIFCSRKEEAYRLADELNEQHLRRRRLRTLALTGDDSVPDREAAVRALERGELDYLITVDVFNEGVDIPTVNQVVMLRQTESAIVFVQQLGRGLRKAPGKEYLVVIDFIGNYANNYLIPVALFGDDSLNRESLREKLIAAEERGSIAGLSSVSFDAIAQERVLRSVQTAKLDSLPNLKTAIETVRNRLGRMPELSDFLRFESVDPVVLATRLGSYPALITKLFPSESSAFTARQLSYLQMLSSEVLDAKRLHESVLLKHVLAHPELTHDDVGALFSTAGIPATAAQMRSAINTLTLDWHTDIERKRYDGAAPLERIPGGVRLHPEFARSYAELSPFRAHVDDLLMTTQRLVVERFDLRDPFTAGRQYSRKDASRILNWSSNKYSTIYGYRVDTETGTCPIFLRLHKPEEVSASTAYEDTLLDPKTLLWYTRSRRTLESAEVKAIVDNVVDLHVFVQKDDADGAGHYYLGRATAKNAEQTVMQRGEPLPVVRMLLEFDEPVDPEVYLYFNPVVTD